MLACLGGSLASCCGGEVAGDSEAEPQLLEPECEEDIELVRCLGTCTAPAASLRFTICAESALDTRHWDRCDGYLETIDECGQSNGQRWLGVLAALLPPPLLLLTVTAGSCKGRCEGYSQAAGEGLTRGGGWGPRRHPAQILPQLAAAAAAAARRADEAEARGPPEVVSSLLV